MEIGWKLHFQTLFLKQLFVWSLDIYLVKQCINVFLFPSGYSLNLYLVLKRS